MAADNEHRLVSKVIRDREINTAIQRGVNESWFLDDDNKKERRTSPQTKNGIR